MQICSNWRICIYFVHAVTFYNFIRLCLVTYFMTVQEYNKSVAEFADSVYRFIRGNLRDDERANDIVQDSYERLWRNVTEIEYTVVKSLSLIHISEPTRPY